MSTTKTLIELAVGFAAGEYTEDAISEMVGDDGLASVISIASGLGVGIVAGGIAKSVLDNDDVTSFTDDVDDFLDDINPFNW